MPGLIWVRDLVAGDVMVDRSFRAERLRPLGLSRAATLAREPQELCLDALQPLRALIDQRLSQPRP
jgi:hypothetical protein